MHLGWLDQIRGAAALYVVCHHAVMQVVIVGEHAHDPIFRIIQLLTSYGHYAVDIFIVLSGYCLMLPIIAKQQFGNVWVFYLRRTVRIVLPYYVAMAATLLLIFLWLAETNSTWASHSLPVTADSILNHMLLIHQWFPDAALKINGAFWSVGVEYQIYFLFPVFYFLAKNIGFISSLTIVTLISYGLWGISFYLDSFNPGPNGASLYYCSLFFMGMVAAHLAKQPQEGPKGDWLGIMDQHSGKLALAALAGVLLIALANFMISRFLPSAFFPLQIQSFFIGLFVAVLLCLKGRNTIRGGLLNHRTIQNCVGWIGTIGFSVYLLHDPVIALVWSYVVAPMNLPLYWEQSIAELVIGLGVTLVLAMVFYKWVELPCHRLSKSIVIKMK